MLSKTGKRMWLFPGIFVALALSVAAFGFSGGFMNDRKEIHRSGPVLLYLEAGIFDPLDRLSPPREELLEEDVADEGQGEEALYFIVQFEGSIREEWKGELSDRGGRILGYLPKHAYLVKGSREAARSIGEMKTVRWIGRWIPEFKLSSEWQESAPKSGGNPTQEEVYVALLFPGEPLDEALPEVRGCGVDILRAVDMSEVTGGSEMFPDRFVFHADPDGVYSVAALNAVAWIEPLLLPEKRNDQVQWVIQSNVTDLRSVWHNRIFGDGQIIGHIDGHIDVNSCYFRDDEHPIGPSHRKIVAYRSSTGIGSDAHGTHTAGTAAGDATYYGDGWIYNGMAPDAKLSHTSLSEIDNSNLAQYLLYAYQDGALVHTNSWGNDWTTDYTQWCRDIDQFSYEYEDNLVLFAVTNMSTLKTPENAKNCLAVGATSRAPDQEEHCTGGRGPTADGRRKPEIYAPGCDTHSARNSQECDISIMSGTSMASPAVAGAAALVREYFEDGWYPRGIPRDMDAGFLPTGALIKAALINGAVDMAGVSGYPSDREGWGRLLLENVLYFDGDPHGLIIRDIRMRNGLLTGDRQVMSFRVTDGDLPLRVTLAWHDYPASVGAAFTPVNDLDLFIRSPGGAVYRGNVFSNGQSIPGGTSDPLNNCEQIHIDHPEVGEWGLLVRGSEVNMGPQGYALVISGEVSDRMKTD